MSFSAGDVLTAAALNDLSIDSLVVDTDVLVVDKTNNRVGIGTTSPSYTLDVNGTGRFTGALEVDGIVTLGDEIKGGSGSAADPVFTFASDGDTGMYSAGTNALGFATAGTSRVVIESDGDLRPGTDGTIELGTTTYRWQAVHSDRYYLADTDSYMQWDGDSGSGIDGPGFRFVINGSEMFKFCRENNDSNHSMLQFGETNDGILYEKDAEKFNFYRNGTQVFEIEDSIYCKVSSATLLASNPPTGTGNDAEWAAPLGIWVLRRNSSLAAEKENISADLDEHLTADMIDSVVPKMWNRTNAPGYPEIGPLAEDMDAISPFLAARGTTAENVPFLTGIN